MNIVKILIPVRFAIKFIPRVRQQFPKSRAGFFRLTIRTSVTIELPTEWTQTHLYPNNIHRRPWLLLQLPHKFRLSRFPCTFLIFRTAHSDL